MEIDRNLLNKTGIYQLKIENHKYVGSSVNLLHRLRSHYSYLKRGKHDNEYLQRCVNKYGIDLLSYSILEFLPTEITTIDLLKREKFYIESTKADLNLKKDPVTQQGCVTTCKIVYQFNQFGELLKEWPSETEAAKYYSINSSNIIKACKNPERQRLAAGFLWSFESIYKYPLKVIYVFDLNGKYLSRHQNTVEVYETYFPNDPRKRVLSQLKKKIDYHVPYKNIYLSSIPNFSIISENRMGKYNLLEWLRNTNPLINMYNVNGTLRSSVHYLDMKNPETVRKKLRNVDLNELKKKTVINLEVDTFKNSSKIIVKDLKTNKETNYDSATKAVIGAFEKYDESLYRNTIKHIQRGTPYKGFLFMRDL